VEDREKITNKIAKLNKRERGNPWDEVEGFNILPSITFDGGHPATANRGVAVKIFINKDTGETRIFPAEAFRAPRYDV
jgi:hypothetical protein